MKPKNQAKVDQFKKQVFPYVKEYKLKLEEIQPWHFRISFNGKSIDLYPTSNRCFDLQTEEWDNYEDPIELLEEFFT